MCEEFLKDKIWTIFQRDEKFWKVVFEFDLVRFDKISQELSQLSWINN
jgi:hypothetical protein